MLLQHREHTLPGLLISVSRSTTSWMLPDRLSDSTNQSTMYTILLMLNTALLPSIGQECGACFSFTILLPMLHLGLRSQLVAPEAYSRQNAQLGS